MERVTRIDISLKSIFTIFAVIFGLYISWKLQGIIVALLVSLIFTAGLAPFVDYLHNVLKINKGIAILIAYFLTFGILIFISFMILPPLISQITDLFSNLPYFLGVTVKTLGFKGTEKETADWAQSVMNFATGRWEAVFGQVVQITMDIVSGFFAFFTVAIFTFFLLLERDQIKTNLFKLIPRLPQERTTHLAHMIEKKLGAWLIGQLLLGLIVGAITWVGLFILQVPYALPLSVIAGVLELIPIIGPILSAVPAVIVALVVSPILGLTVGIFFILVQQVENNIIVPKIMERAVGLSPLLTILALLVGASLYGMMGALLAVPITATIKLLYLDYLENGLKDAH